MAQRERVELLGWDLGTKHALEKLERVKLALQETWRSMAWLTHLTVLEEEVQVGCVGPGHAVHHPLRHSGKNV